MCNLIDHQSQVDGEVCPNIYVEFCLICIITHSDSNYYSIKYVFMNHFSSNSFRVKNASANICRSLIFFHLGYAYCAPVSQGINHPCCCCLPSKQDNKSVACFICIVSRGNLKLYASKMMLPGTRREQVLIFPGI